MAKEVPMNRGKSPSCTRVCLMSFRIKKSKFASKKGEGNRYKEYIFGPINAFDMEWADSVVDCKNQGIEIRNISNKAKLERKSTVCTEDDYEYQDAPYVCLEDDKRSSLVPNATNRESIADVIENVHQLSLKLGTETQMRKSVEVECENIKKELEKVKQENKQLRLINEQYHKDALLYRKLQEDTEKLNLEDFKNESNTKIEDLLDAIYSTIYEAFGPKSSLTLGLEELADSYLKRESAHELEVQGQKRQIEILSKFDRVLNEKGDFGDILQQKTKIIDSLVEQLKTAKDESLRESLNLRERLKRLSQQVDESAKSARDLQMKHDQEKAEMETLLKISREEYRKLLMDQHELISQLPLAKIQTVESNSAANDPDLISRQHVGTLESLVQALYRKDAETQRILQQKDKIMQQQQLVIQRLESVIREWESDAVLWLEFIDNVKLSKVINQ